METAVADIVLRVPRRAAEAIALRVLRRAVAAVVEDIRLRAMVVVAVTAEDTPPAVADRIADGKS